MDKKELIMDKFGEIISEALSAGVQRGMQVFTEEAEEDLARAELFESGVEVTDIIDRLIEE